MDMVVGKRCKDWAKLAVRFPRAMDADSLTTRSFLAFFEGKHSSTLAESVKTLAIHRAAIVSVVVPGEHNECMQFAALVVVAVREGQGKVKKRRNKSVMQGWNRRL